MFKNFIENINKVNKESFPNSHGEEFRFFSRVSSPQRETIFDIAKKLELTNVPEVKSTIMCRILDILKRSTIAELITYMKNDCEIIRSASAQVFAELDSPNLFKCLEAMIQDKSVNLRISCIEAANYTGSIETIKLLEKGITDNSPGVRMQSAIGLADLAHNYKSNYAISLLNAAINDPDQDIREFVIDELGLIGNHHSLAQLLTAMECSDEDEQEMISESLRLILSKSMM